jgi:phytoene dehydrogenase-like protein
VAKERQKFDAIVVGAGHNGLCLAAYLQRAGLKTLVCERRHEEGGGVNTEEPVAPGFYHNMHAQYMEFIDYMPFYWDFELEKLGARMIYPEAQAGIAFSDGRPPIVIHRPDLLDRTHASIARYSKADADTFVELKRKAMEIDQLFAAGLYSPPLPGASRGDYQAQATAVLEHLGLDPIVAFKQPRVIIDELFETPELRALLYRCCVEWGIPVEQEMGGNGFVIAILWLIGIWKLSVGGTHTLAHAMKQACLREGVTFRESSPVTKILLDDNGVCGVRIRSGEEFEARIVACNADVRQVFLDLVGEENLSDTYRRRAKNFRYGPSHVLGTTAWAIYDPPHFKSAEHDPEIDRCFYMVVGFDSPEEVLHYIRQAYGDELPDNPGAGIWVNTLWDRTQAPPGLHALTGWFFFPVASALTEEEWAEVRSTYNYLFYERLREFAPNMTWDNVIGHRLYTPIDMEHKNLMINGDFSNGAFHLDQMGSNRPFPEASRYKTEIQGLYLCGPSSYPGGGVHAACGYNAFKVICEDYGLPKVWKRPGRPY